MIFGEINSRVNFENTFKVHEDDKDGGVICTDVDKLVSRVCKARGWSPGEVEVVKIGVDSGQGSLKASMSLLREEDLQPGA